MFQPAITNNPSVEIISENPKKERLDFSHRYYESTQETLRVLYQVRDTKTGETIENINDVIYRVAESVALAELKYVLSPQELAWIKYDDAINYPIVLEYREKFADAIGNQKFWANTPANINADPKVSLMVLKYWELFLVGKKAKFG